MIKPDFANSGKNNNSCPTKNNNTQVIKTKCLCKTPRKAETNEDVGGGLLEFRLATERPWRLGMSKGGWLAIGLVAAGLCYGDGGF